ncbi:MAG: hypothetical protein WAL80_14060 [Xanthobacteraceae bacterium]
MPARLFTLAFGLAAVIWGAYVVPLMGRQISIERIASYIVERESFNRDALLSILPAVASVERDTYCRPVTTHSAAIIRLRLVEDAMAAGAREDIDDRMDTLQQAIRNSLACSAADPFLWTVLAWLDGIRNGYRPEQLAFLRLSYRLGPNEGWVAARRNSLALSIFDRLPPDLANAAVGEFGRMVHSWIYWDTIAIFTGPGWPIRDRLLASLGEVGQRQREAFSQALYAQGYDIAVPGIAPRDPRPWH